MTDISWIATEAKSIHAIFCSIFYSLALVLLLIGIVLEYFKIPLGGMPSFTELVGRTLIAAILLNCYPEVSNTIADFTDALAERLGDFNHYKLVLGKMGDRLWEFSISWTSVKETVMLAISFLTFFLLYISVYIADAGILYVWVLLYVFSPLLIVLFILPITAGATKALYRSLLEVSAWKIVWSVLATLLWSVALSDINKPDSKVNFLTAISLNLMLAMSLLLTPLIVNALISKGISGLAATMGGVAAGTAMLKPGSIAKNVGTKVIAGPASAVVGNAGEGIKNVTLKLKERYFSPQTRHGTQRITPRKQMAPTFTEKSTTTVNFKSAMSKYRPPEMSHPNNDFQS